MTGKPLLIDTHAHLCFPELDSDLKNVIDRASLSNITRIINIASGSGLGMAGRCYEISSLYQGVYNSVGVHPDEVSSFTEPMLSRIAEYADHRDTVAIGEVGIDLYRSPENLELQEKIFRRFISVAKSRKLPLVIHQRNAFIETIKVLKEESAFSSVGVVFHCFGGSREEADTILDLGGYISLTGIITFKKAASLRETVRCIPVERIMAETDSPFLAPEPKRGKRNEPSYLVHVVKEIARIKGISFEEAAAATTANAVEFFRL